jgi:hypothetical protein
MKTYPAGTTEKQWADYKEELMAHEQYISNYKFFLERIVSYLEFAQPNAGWTTDEIKIAITTEIKRAHSMDAPNKPGYYRANND